MTMHALVQPPQDPHTRTCWDFKIRSTSS